ncbi:SufD family Fe-S cluster assembly protein [Candidatus Gottesmanbacteria bacterium]|nr:SufD family Fe-S cluster assembly protein [Candidatus Gottesmanbacteria bacterium]
MKIAIVHIKRKAFKKTFQIQNAHVIVLLIAGRKEQEIDITIRLTNAGSRADIIGLVTASDSDSITLHTRQYHGSRETTSNLLVKSLLADAASFTYDGAIRVEPKAQKTDAYQRNENLLLSDQAHAESKPKLEILANDVRCTHGATIGSVRDDELWYLASRGIEKKEAIALIARGFLGSVVEKISDRDAQKKVYAFINSAI